MKVLEWILNGVFSIASLWDRSRDELLNEHRAYERNILVYTAIAAIFLVVAILISPSIEMMPTDGFKYFTYSVGRYFGLGALALGAFSFIASLWNMIELLYFRYKYGISENNR